MDMEIFETPESTEAPSGLHTGTYSPDDNKLRIYSLRRLDEATYNRAEDLGFRWAPKQELFVAPMWTPAREDFVLELCGDISDEDKSLSDRAEERSDRFDDYSIKRAREADGAYKSVKSIADHIPFGQPILVGHHSERRARKDAERIRNGMHRAVNLFETSEYWTRRAASAIRHAKYKERPDVRFRRMKVIEADKRKRLRTIKDVEKFLSTYRDPQVRDVMLKDGRNFLRALLTTYEGGLSSDDQRRVEQNELSIDEGLKLAIRNLERTVAHCQRWISHYDNRLAYEKAMLGEVGGIPAEKFNIEPGGAVLARGVWMTVKRVNRKEGRIVSVSTDWRYGKVRSIEEVKDYRAPTSEQKRAAVKTRIVANYPGDGIAELTAAEWEKIPKDYKGTVEIAATDSFEAHRQRHAIGLYVFRGERDMNKRHAYVSVYITDKPLKRPAAPCAGIPAPSVAEQTIQCPVATSEPAGARSQPMSQGEPSELRQNIAKVKASLSAGVKVVVADQLLQTPRALAARVVREAEPREGLRWLEPSAGPGRLCDAILASVAVEELVTVEISQQVCRILSVTNPTVKIFTADFLAIDANELGTFDRIVINPPFANGDDIKHIEKAATLLKPGGILVAICAHGPRQQAALTQWACDSGGFFERLEDGTFKESGTSVSTAILKFVA